MDSLIQGCIKGDSLAWSEFVNRFSRLIFWTIKDKINKLHFSISDTDIYDIYQQVFLLIWQKQKLKNIKNPKAISRWLVVVTQNATLDYIRKRVPVENRENIDEIELVYPYVSDNETRNNGLKKDIEFFVNDLPLKERRIATLDIFYELEYVQISRIVSLPQGTISSVVKRVKEDLKKYLVSKSYKV